MEFDPVRAQRTAADLEALADRLETDLRDNAAALAPPAPSVDEVSMRSASTLGEVAASYQQAGDSGVGELRQLAAALRSQSTTLVGMDDENASGLQATA